MFSTTNSEHPGHPTRPPASALLLVDSTDRYGTGWPLSPNSVKTSSEWRLNFPTNVLSGYFTRLALTQLNFQWNIPTILTGYNDSLRMSVVSLGSQTITLAQGWYSPTDMATQLQTALQTAYPTNAFTVSFNQTLGGFTFSGTNDFWFVAPTSAGGGVPTDVYVRTYKTLGLIGNTNNVNPPNNSYTAGIPSMVATGYIDICSSYLTKYQRVKDSSTLINQPRQDMIARLYPVAPNTRIDLTSTASIGSHPFNICVDYNVPKQMMWSPDEAISNFDIQVRDELGELLPFTPRFGCEYQMTFLVTET